MKAEHLKKKGDESIKSGNLRSAWENYSEALGLDIDSELKAKLLSNRSLAYCRAGRYGDALADADRCQVLRPAWEKAHYRRGAAFLGMGRAVDAAFAFSSACRHSKDDDKSCEQSLHQCVKRMKLEELGQAVQAWLTLMQEQGLIEPPQVETASHVVIGEAWYQLMRAENSSGKPPWTYHKYLMQWFKEGLPPCWAYQMRGRMHCKAKCYLQARKDAMLSIQALVDAMVETNNLHAPVLEHELAASYDLLGTAYLAQEKHPDEDLFSAAKAFYRAGDLHPDAEPYWDSIKSLGTRLSLGKMQEAARGAAKDAARGKEGGLRNPVLLGLLDHEKGLSETSLAILLVVHAPQIPLHRFNSDMREALLQAVAAESSQPKSSVVLQKVFVVQQGFEAEVVVQFGGSKDDAEKFLRLSALSSSFLQTLRRREEDLGSMLIGGGASVVTSLLGHCGQQSNSEQAQNAAPEVEETITEPALLKMELELPYKTYSLVYSDGSAVPRKLKHAFGMTIVRYDAVMRTREVWIQINDGSCRWYQSSSEIKIIALKVPPELKSSQLEVQMSPYFLKVANKETGEVYLEGQLERGIIPDGSVWVAGQGEGEDGFMFMVQKMNLELLQTHHMHNKMWWPKLFVHHSEIAWDDSEHDYSDLPKPVMDRYRAQEALESKRSHIESAERKGRERLDDLDDARLRWREDRLYTLRHGTSNCIYAAPEVAST